MKNLSLLLAILMLSGCLAGPNGPRTSALLDPSTPSSAGPVSVTLYSNSFSSLLDLSGWADHPGTQCCGTAVNPYLNTIGSKPYHSGPSSAYFPVYSATVDRFYDKALVSYNGDIEATYYVLGAPREVVIGYSNGIRQTSAYRFHWVGTSFQVQVVSGSTWVTLMAYNSGNINLWHEYKFYFHSASHLTDYLVDGLPVATGVDSYTNGAIRYIAFTGFTIATKKGYDDVQIDDITIVGH